VKLPVLGCCLLLLASGANAEGERLRWLINDFPPFTEVGPELPGQGIHDDMLRYLQAHLPQYQHQFEVASFARTYALMERGEPVCHPTTLKMPGRERSMLFSRPVVLLASQQVLVRQDRLPRLRPYLDPQGRVDVRRLLRDDQLVTAVSERRGYSPAISAALEELGPQPHVLKAGVKFNAPFQQLTAGWIDYLFAYPVELGWYRRHPHRRPALHARPRRLRARRLGRTGDPRHRPAAAAGRPASALDRQGDRVHRPRRPRTL
jgi:uncharacterized protein (TIGR02285 family)